MQLYGTECTQPTSQVSETLPLCCFIVSTDTSFSDAAVIDALFSTTIIKTRICSGCNDSSITTSTEYTIGAPFEHADSLVNLINGEGVFGTETVSDFRCCAGKDVYVPQVRHQKISTSPEILVLQIRRFGTQGIGIGTNGRIRRDCIPFAEYLDLSAFAEGKAALKYRVLAVVQHRGTMKNGFATGHYITLARGPNRQWAEINDHEAITHVDPMPNSERISFRHASRTGDTSRPIDRMLPYLIFYERVGGEVADAPIRANDRKFWEARERDLTATRKIRKRANSNGVSKKSSQSRTGRR